MFIIVTGQAVRVKTTIAITITIIIIMEEFVKRKVQVQVILLHVFHLVDLHEIIKVVDFLLDFIGLARFLNFVGIKQSIMQGLRQLEEKRDYLKGQRELDSQPWLVSTIEQRHYFRFKHKNLLPPLLPHSYQNFLRSCRRHYHITFQIISITDDCYYSSLVMEYSQAIIIIMEQLSAIMVIIISRNYVYYRKHHQLHHLHHHLCCDLLCQIHPLSLSAITQPSLASFPLPSYKQYQATDLQ